MKIKDALARLIPIAKNGGQLQLDEDFQALDLLLSYFAGADISQLLGDIDLVTPVLAKNLTLDDTPHYEAVGRIAEAAKRMYVERIGIQENVATLTCVFCGHIYPSGTPTANHKALADHVMECPEHPAAALRKQLEKMKDDVEFTRGISKINHDMSLRLGGERDAARKEVETYKKVVNRATKIFDECCKHFGASCSLDTLAHNIEELKKEVREVRQAYDELALISSYWIDPGLAQALCSSIDTFLEYVAEHTKLVTEDDREEFMERQQDVLGAIADIKPTTSKLAEAISLLNEARSGLRIYALSACAGFIEKLDKFLPNHDT